MLLIRVSKRWFVQRLQAHRLTLPQFISLSALAAHKHPCTMSDITNATFQDPPTTTGVVDRLVKMKLVERTRSETDRRVVLVLATQAGVDLVNHIETDLMKESAPGYAMLTKEEVMTFEKLTKRMLQIHLQRTMSLDNEAIEAEIEKMEQLVNDPIAYSKLDNEKR